MSLYHLTDENDAIQSDLKLNVPSLKIKNVSDGHAQNAGILFTGNGSVSTGATTYTGIEKNAAGDLVICTSDGVATNTNKYIFKTGAQPAIQVSTNLGTPTTWINGTQTSRAGTLTNVVLSNTVGFTNVTNLTTMYTMTGEYMTLYGNFDATIAAGANNFLLTCDEFAQSAGITAIGIITVDASVATAQNCGIIARRTQVNKLDVIFEHNNAAGAGVFTFSAIVRVP